MGLSACIEWLFAAEHPDFVDRIHAAAAAGLEGVEFHLWRDKPLEAIRAALDETGLRLTGMVVEPRCRLADPASHAAFAVAVRETLVTARKLGAEKVIPSVGLALVDTPHERQRDTILAALRQAVEIADGEGVDLLIEPVNSKVDHPGMYLDTTPKGLELVERLDSPRVRLLYDIYHSATMGETPEGLFAGRTHLLGYVQVADSPGRHEPGSGAVDWDRYLKLLDTLGYRGTIGLEYKPTGDTQASLDSTRRSLRLER